MQLSEIDGGGEERSPGSLLDRAYSNTGWNVMQLIDPDFSAMLNDPSVYMFLISSRDFLFGSGAVCSSSSSSLGLLLVSSACTGGSSGIMSSSSLPNTSSSDGLGVRDRVFSMVLDVAFTQVWGELCN